MRKTADLKIRIEPDLVEDFREACAAEHKKMASVLRDLIRNFVKRHRESMQKDLFGEQGRQEATLTNAYHHDTESPNR
ncbi:MAG: plasmid-related protein [Gammaproteobacteria bacterium]|nr:plasmid-related protein [Gammaproteobacteria bacterium]